MKEIDWNVTLYLLKLLPRGQLSCDTQIVEVEMGETHSAYEHCNHPTHLKNLGYSIAQYAKEIQYDNLCDWICG